MATKTRKDYEEEAILRNWATAQPGSYYSTGNGMQQYTGWNGGSVTGADMMAAVGDANRYDYDIMLDPRNNGGARDAIGNLLLDVSEKANADAVAGIGDYDSNRQNYLNQIGWTDYQQVFKNLQDTGSLGLKTLDGQSIEDAYKLGNPNWMSNEQWAAYEKEMAPIWAEQQAMMDQMAQQQAYFDAHLSPLMQQGGGEKGGAWGYNQEEDPVWDAILKQYTRAGEKGMNDVLAQLSARTGGLASSYAGQVAQQTMNDYMQGATDYIPQLYEAAYGRYMDEQEMNIAAEERAYQRQQDALDRQLAADQTAWERQAYADELAYNREQDALDRQFSEDQFNWEQQKYWNSQNKGAGKSEYDFDWAYDLLMSGVDSPVARDIFQKATGAEWSDDYIPVKDDEDLGKKYDDVAARAAKMEDMSELKAFLERSVDEKFISPEESWYLWQIYGEVETAPTTYEEFVERYGTEARSLGLKSRETWERNDNYGKSDGYRNYEEYLAAMWQKLKQGG